MKPRSWFIKILAAGSVLASLSTFPLPSEAHHPDTVHIRAGTHSERHHWRIVGRTATGDYVLELVPTVRHPLRHPETTIVTPEYLAAETHSPYWMWR